MRLTTIAVFGTVLPLLVFGSVADAAEGGPVVAEGASYVSARDALMKAGYKPVAHETAGRCSALSAVCTTYPETTACVTANSGTCRFEWTRGTGTAVAAIIETRGETPDRLVVIRAFEGASALSPYPLGTTN